MVINQLKRKLWRKINQQPESNRSAENLNLNRGGHSKHLKNSLTKI